MIAVVAEVRSKTYQNIVTGNVPDQNAVSIKRKRSICDGGRF